VTGAGVKRGPGSPGWTAGPGNVRHVTPMGETVIARPVTFDHTFDRDGGTA